MTKKRIAYLLVSCMLFQLLLSNVAQAQNTDAETAQTESGLQVSWDIDWSSDTPALMENAAYHTTDEELYADILWDPVYSIKNGENPVSADDLHFYKQNETTGAYEASTDVTVSARGTENELLQFSFAKCGNYHISLDTEHANQTDQSEDSTSDTCIPVFVDYPEIALYRTEQLSEEGIIKENPVQYHAGDSWYILTHPTEYTDITDVSWEPIGETPDLLFQIQQIEENTKYKVTANAAVAIDGDAGILLNCKAADKNDPENVWFPECAQYFTPQNADEKKGLLTSNWMYWDEDLQKDVPSDAFEGFNNFTYTTLEDKLCVKYNDGTRIETGEDGTALLLSEPITAQKIKVYTADDHGQLMEAPKELVTYHQNETASEFIDFSFQKCGCYLISYQADDGKEYRAIVNVQYPQGAFYTSDACTENTLIRGIQKYNNQNNTFYFVIKQYEDSDESGKITMRPLVVTAPDIKTDGKATVEKISDTVYKITVKPDLTDEFDIIAEGCQVRWDEQSETDNIYSEVHLQYEKAPDPTVNPDDKLAATPTAKPDDKPAATPTPKPDDNKPAAQKNIKAENGSKVTTYKDGTCIINTAAAKKKAKSVTVPNTVVVNGVKYTVTAVGANAFRSVANTVTTITLPSTITKINKNAFKGLTKLKKITMKVKKPVKVTKGAFQGTNTKKVTLIISKKMKKKDLKKFQSNLKKAGFKGTVKTK